MSHTSVLVFQSYRQQKKTKQRGNAAQMTLMRNYMSDHKDFAHNEVDNAVYWATWESLTAKLNAKGTIRTAKAWEKV